MTKPIGPSFVAELTAAGLTGLPFCWGEDGRFTFGEAMTTAQIDAVLAVYDAHDPTRPAPPPAFLPVQGARATRLTIADLATTGAVTFPVALPDLLYLVLPVVSGFTGAVPPVGASVVRGVQKTVTGFTLFLAAAPGLGNTITYDCLVVKV